MELNVSQGDLKMKRSLALLVVLMLALTVCSAFAETLTVNIWDNNQRAGLQQIADEWTAISGIDVKIDVNISVNFFPT